MDKRKLRVGVVGCGGIAEIAHMPIYAKLSDKVHLAAVADKDLDQAVLYQKRYGAEHVYTNVSEMFEKEELDAVSICTWNVTHARFAIEALEAGCHVLCEKPPAVTVNEAVQMKNAAEKSGKILMYGFHYRYAPEVELLKKYIDAGELGNVYAAKALFLRRRGIPGWGVFTNRELQGGGPLIDLGVHALDTVLHLMGYPVPKTVLGVTYQEIGNKKGVGLLGEWDWKNYSVEDFARGMITFEDGRSVILETSFACNMEPKETLQLSFMGNKAGADLYPVTLLNQNSTPLRIYGEKYGTLVDMYPVHYVNPQVSYHELEVTEFVNCCLENRRPYSTPEQGVILQKIICGLYESAEKKRAIDL